MSEEKNNSEQGSVQQNKKIWWERDPREEFLERMEKKEEFVSDDSHEYLRVEKILEFWEKKIDNVDEINQTAHLLEIAKESRKEAEEKLVSFCLPEESLFQKNVRGLFNQYFKNATDFEEE